MRGRPAAVAVQALTDAIAAAYAAGGAARADADDVHVAGLLPPVPEADGGAVGAAGQGGVRAQLSAVWAPALVRTRACVRACAGGRVARWHSCATRRPPTRLLERLRTKTAVRWCN